MAKEIQTQALELERVLEGIDVQHPLVSFLSLLSTSSFLTPHSP